MTQPISLAVYELAEQASRLSGRSISAEQVKRLQEASLLPTPQVRGLGQGLGTEAVFPPDCAELVAEASDLIRRHHSMDMAALTLFVRGRPVRERAVRKAHTSMITALAETLYGSIPKAGLTLWNQGRELKAVEARVNRWAASRSRRVTTLAKRLRDTTVVFQGFLDLSYLLLGVDDMSDHISEEAIQVSGLSQGVDLTETEAVLQHLNLRDLVAALDGVVPWERVCLARDAAALTLRICTAASYIVEWAPTLVEGLEDDVVAFRAATQLEEYVIALLAVPAFLIALSAEQMSLFLPWAELNAQRQEARASLLSSLPKNWRRFADDAVLDDASEEERERFHTYLSRWAVKNPANAEVILAHS
jgi:hypothetical protein